MLLNYIFERFIYNHATVRRAKSNLSMFLNVYWNYPLRPLTAAECRKYYFEDRLSTQQLEGVREEVDFLLK